MASLVDGLFRIQGATTAMGGQTCLVQAAGTTISASGTVVGPSATADIASLSVFGTQPTNLARTSGKLTVKQSQSASLLITAIQIGIGGTLTLFSGELPGCSLTAQANANQKKWSFEFDCSGGIE